MEYPFKYIPKKKFFYPLANLARSDTPIIKDCIKHNVYILQKMVPLSHQNFFPKETTSSKTYDKSWKGPPALEHSPGNQDQTKDGISYFVSDCGCN